MAKGFIWARLRAVRPSSLWSGPATRAPGVFRTRRRCTSRPRRHPTARTHAKRPDRIQDSRPRRVPGWTWTAPARNAARPRTSSRPRSPVPTTPSCRSRASHRRHRATPTCPLARPLAPTATNRRLRLEGAVQGTPSPLGARYFSLLPFCSHIAKPSCAPRRRPAPVSLRTSCRADEHRTVVLPLSDPSIGSRTYGRAVVAGFPLCAVRHRERLSVGSLTRPPPPPAPRRRQAAHRPSHRCSPPLHRPATVSSAPPSCLAVDGLPR
jgi:hypothetical protein